MGDGEVENRESQEELLMVYRRHTDLPVYQAAFGAAMEIFVASGSFPKEEVYSLTDQVRRSSRSVCANIAEAWRKRRSEAFFISTLNVSEAEAAETQVRIQFAVECEYLPREKAKTLYTQYDEILAQLVSLIRNPSPWIISK